MSKLEKNALKNVMVEASKHGRFFRANVGTGWTSNEKPIRISGSGIVSVKSGDVVLRNARPLSTGLPNGFPDVVGLTRVEITPEMVGQVIGVFTGLEVKSDTGRPTADQKKIGEVIKSQGGKWGVVRSEEDAARVCKE